MDTKRKPPMKSEPVSMSIEDFAWNLGLDLADWYGDGPYTLDDIERGAKLTIRRLREAGRT